MIFEGFIEVGKTVLFSERWIVFELLEEGRKKLGWKERKLNGPEVGILFVET